MQVRKQSNNGCHGVLGPDVREGKGTTGCIADKQTYTNACEWRNRSDGQQKENVQVECMDEGVVVHSMNGILHT